MENNETYSAVQAIGRWLRKSLLVKFAVIGFILILLLIPQSMVRSLINERQYRQMDVTREVSEKWGAAQTVTGPVLVIPFRELYTQSDGKELEYKRKAYFLPQNLRINGQLENHTRKRGIYDVLLYRGILQLEGNFPAPNWEALKINPDMVVWNEARLAFGISDLAGIDSSLQLNWGNQALRLEPGTSEAKLLPAGVSVGLPVTDASTAAGAFNLKMQLRGNEYIHFAPVGQETTASMQSPWPSPSFDGSFLPKESNISEAGFTASWGILDLNRNYPQQWTEHDEYSLKDNTFGVRLVQPVDGYAKNDRSTKYALFILALVFLSFFFFETLQHFDIHPFQYLMVGLAISIFYLLLLSLSEHLGFNKAYLAAAAATVGLILFYSRYILKSWRMFGQLAFLLVAIYSFVFVVLQLEDYALLVGSLGLFATLAAVMYLSRNVDWYNLSKGE